MERKIKWHPNRKVLEIIREKFQKGKTFWKEGCLPGKRVAWVIGVAGVRSRAPYPYGGIFYWKQKGGIRSY